MAHTYGEVLPSSFPTVFACLGPATTGVTQRTFVDLGSGYGAICRAAVESGHFDQAIGVEKYSDKLEASIRALEECCAELRSKLAFQKGDINDFNYSSLVQPRGAVCVFCNNVAFNNGTIQRSGAQLLSFLQQCRQAKCTAVVVSMMPLHALQERLLKTVLLDTTWGFEQHLTEVYS